MPCPLYKVDVRTLQSRELAPHAQGSDSVQLHLRWCAHRHSPAQLDVVSRVIGGANLLQCGGDLDRCQVPNDLR